MWYYTFVLWASLTAPTYAPGLVVTSGSLYPTDTACILAVERVAAFYQLEGMDVKFKTCWIDAGATRPSSRARSRAPGRVPTTIS